MLNIFLMILVYLVSFSISISGNTQPNKTQARDPLKKANPSGDAPGTLSDAQIIQALMAINEAEIEAAKMAQQKAKQEKVKSFASMMIDEHSKNTIEIQAMSASGAPASTRESALSKMLTQESMKTTQALSSASDFDKAYIAHQVKMHEKALDTIRGQLLPSAASVEVRTHLEKTAQSVANHLTQVRTLQTEIR